MTLLNRIRRKKIEEGKQITLVELEPILDEVEPKIDFFFKVVFKTKWSASLICSLALWPFFFQKR